MPFDFTPYTLKALPGAYAEIHDLAATDDRRRVVAVVNGLLERDEQIAFTHLFAAAPDLLAACVAVLTLVESSGQISLAANLLREAIAKTEAA